MEHHPFRLSFGSPVEYRSSGDSLSKIIDGKDAVSGARGCCFGIDITGPYILVVKP
jgi:hypothetical protein